MDRWDEIEALFNRVAELPEESRAAVLADTDPALRRKVEELLAGLPEAERFFAGAVNHAREELAGALPAFGPWRATGTLGHGGMGVVYKAVRDDGYFVKEAAVKVLQFGLLNPGERDRFRQERQILANLEHPNIARLLDGGETQTGLPYLVLEYVDGVPVTEYCDQRGLGRRQRIELFLSICAAVDAAHQQLIVHRDLKPANILVTGDGTPKLLDFGIAKLLDAESSRTVTGVQAMTPQYASPEQVRGRAIGTTSDVYSLGVILYELLTGRRPYEVTTHAPGELERVICETLPAAPRLSADLDNILMMALRKEPPRRYSGPRAFAEDLERALTDRPVQARPDSFRYRFSKFVRRNRWPLAGAAAVALAVAGGVGATLFQARRAETRFNQVRQLASTLLFDYYSKLEDIPAAGAAREELVKISLNYLNSLAAEASGDPTLREELGRGFLQLGDIQGSADARNLGRRKEAVDYWTRAEVLLRGLPSIAARTSHAIVLNRLGNSANSTGDPEKALRYYQQVVDEAGQVLREMPTSSRASLIVGSALNLMGDLHLSAGRVDEARRHYIAARDLKAAFQGDKKELRQFDASVLARLADATFLRGKVEEAVLIAAEHRRVAETAFIDEPYHPFRTALTAFSLAQPAKFLCSWPVARAGCANALADERVALRLALQSYREDPTDAGSKAVLIEIASGAVDHLPAAEMAPYARVALAASAGLTDSPSIDDRDSAAGALALAGYTDLGSGGGRLQSALEISRRNLAEAPQRVDLALHLARRLELAARHCLVASEAQRLRKEAAAVLAPMAARLADHWLLIETWRALVAGSR